MHTVDLMFNRPPGARPIAAASGAAKQCGIKNCLVSTGHCWRLVLQNKIWNQMSRYAHVTSVTPFPPSLSLFLSLPLPLSLSLLSFPPLSFSLSLSTSPFKRMSAPFWKIPSIPLGLLCASQDIYVAKTWTCQVCQSKLNTSNPFAPQCDSLILLECAFSRKNLFMLFFPAANRRIVINPLNTLVPS